MTAAMKLLCMLCGCARRLIRFGMTVNYGLIGDKFNFWASKSYYLGSFCRKTMQNSSLSQRNHVCLKTLNQFATALYWIAQLSKDKYAEFLACQATPTATPGERPARIRKFWKAPPADMVKINFNRVVFFGENKSGIKVVIRDSSGSGIASCSKKILYAFSSCEVEALDAATDLSFVSEIGINKVVLEGDPLVAIKALIKPESPLSSIGPWIEVWRL